MRKASRKALKGKKVKDLAVKDAKAVKGGAPKTAKGGVAKTVTSTGQDTYTAVNLEERLITSYGPQ
jgi:hypothetical protein